MKLPILLLLAFMCLVTSEPHGLNLFEKTLPFPEVCIREDLSGASSEGASVVSLAFVAGGHTHFCSRLDTENADTNPRQICLKCAESVPNDWEAGIAVFAAINSVEELLHVGYVYDANEDVTEDFGHTSNSLKRSLNAHDEFMAWVRSGNLRDLTRGVELARNRQLQLKELLSEDAELVCHLRIPEALRDTLPASVLQFVEEPIDTYATLSHIIEDGFQKDKYEVLPSITLEETGVTFSRKSSGSRANAMTTRPVPVWGSIFRSGTIVVSQSAARQADSTELQRWQRKRSPSEFNVAVVAGKPIWLPKSVDVYRFGLQITSQDKSSVENSISLQSKKRSALADTVPSATAIRPIKSLLYVATNFAGTVPPYTAADFTAAVQSAARFFQLSTYGALTTFNFTLRMVTLSKTAAEYYGRADIEAEARTLVTDVDWRAFDHYVVFYMSSCCAYDDFAGRGTLGGFGAWVRVINADVLAHELGHNLGMMHSNFLKTATGWSVGPYVGLEYGNPADWMGSGSTQNDQLTVVHKQRLGILPVDNILYPVRSGVYRLYAHDTNVLNGPNKPQAMRIGLSRFLEYSKERSFHVEFRNQSTLKGVSILLAGSGEKQTELVNAYPNNPAAVSGFGTQATLPSGASFIDERANIMITNLGANYLDATPYVDLDVQFRAKVAGNRSPTGTVSGPADVARTERATYTVSASDPDGDSLVYAWFYDTTPIDADPTATSVEFVFNEVGNRTVMCHINDRKGGLYIATFMVSVGLRAQWGATVSGTVRDPTGQPIQRAYVWVNSGFDRGATTDHAGTFTITNVAPNPVVVNFTASAAYSLPCQPQFTNPVRMNASAARFDIDFVCYPAPVVSLSTNVVGPVPNGTAIPFTITRTGDTSSSLAVQVFCDSEIDEAFVGYSVARTVTIPQGAQSFDFIVRHSRLIFQSDRQTVLYCMLTSSDSFVLSPYFRASVTLGGFAGPDHDNFANARVLSGVSDSFSGPFNNASTEAFEPSIRTTGVWSLCPSVWFRWMAPGSGNLVLSWNATYESNVQVYVGNSLRSLILMSPTPDLLPNPLQMRVQQGVEYKVHFYSCFQPQFYVWQTPRPSEYTLNLQLNNANFAPQVAFPPEDTFDLPPFGSGSSSPSAGGGSSPTNIGGSGSNPSAAGSSPTPSQAKGAPSSSVVNAGSSLFSASYLSLFISLCIAYHLVM